MSSSWNPPTDVAEHVELVIRQWTADLSDERAAAVNRANREAAAGGGRSRGCPLRSPRLVVPDGALVLLGLRFLGVIALHVRRLRDRDSTQSRFRSRTLRARIALASRR